MPRSVNPVSLAVVVVIGVSPFDVSLRRCGAARVVVVDFDFVFVCEILAAPHLPIRRSFVIVCAHEVLRRKTQDDETTY
jgi:hypothetical protein